MCCRFLDALVTETAGVPVELLRGRRAGEDAVAAPRPLSGQELSAVTAGPHWFGCRGRSGSAASRIATFAASRARSNSDRSSVPYVTPQ